jgi:hypothetical protein
MENRLENTVEKSIEYEEEMKNSKKITLEVV